MRLKVLWILPLLAGCNWFSNTVSSDAAAQTDADKEFASAFANLKNNYLYFSKDNLDPESQYNAEMSALFAKVTDKYTSYLNPEQAAALTQGFENPQVEGLIGVQWRYKPQSIDTIPDTLEVYRVLPKSPALQADLRRGDLLLTVNGHSVTADSVKNYTEYTKGGVGVKVVLGLKRKDSLFTVEVAKAEVAVPTVFVDSIEPGISSIQITQFMDQTLDKVEGETTGTYREFLAALQQTATDKATLIDLRQNPGGFISQCVAMVDEMVPSGIIVRSEYRRDGKDYAENISAEPGGMVSDGKRRFVALQDENSASCAEIFLSALADNRKDIPRVGVQSYGKGIGQGFYETYLRGLTKITTLRFLTTDGFAYHGVGIAPTNMVTGYDAQTTAALGLARGTAPLARGLAPARLPWTPAQGDGLTPSISGALYFAR